MSRVLITGASSGIGKELAKQFAMRKHDLVLVARRQELLDELKEKLIKRYKIDVQYFVCDLTKKPKEVYDFCKKNKLSIDVLVNNAGYGDFGNFIDSDLDKNLKMIDLNNKALVSLTYYFLKDMKENGYGHILNVGSVASFVPGPYMAVYYATKSFVMSFSLSLREELRKDNIRVSVLCPAPTKSDFWKVANGKTSKAYNNSYARKPSDAAKTGYDIFEKNKAYAIDGLSYKVLFTIARHLPLELCARAVAYVQKSTKTKKK